MIMPSPDNAPMKGTGTVCNTVRPAMLGILLFALVGGIGFLVDTGVLLIVVSSLKVDPLIGRIMSFFCAATVTFWLNRRYTFAATAGVARAQWLRYVLATGIGAFINIGLFYLWISVAGTRPVQLVTGSAIGALVTMVFNYFIAKTLVFAAPDSKGR